MHQFYFNECLPATAVHKRDLVLFLSKTIKEYDYLIGQNIGVDKGLILEKEIENIIVVQNNLKEIILSIPDKERETRTLAFAYFTKYPIQYHLQSTEIDDKLLEEQYCFEDLDATNLAIAKHNSCFLFSVAVNESIEKNSLRIYGKNHEFDIDNLFGEKQNTLYIESHIRTINAASLELFDQLKVELKDPIYTKAFEKEFKSAKVEVQKSIINNFAAAPDRKLKTPYFPDNREGGLIRDVTPDNNRKNAKVYELRVYRPEALRVYFYEFENTVFISSIGYKKDYKEENGSAQSKDIKKALDEIDKLIKTR